MNRICFISTLLIGLAAKTVFSQQDGFDVSQLQEATALDTCRSDLIEIDEDGDMRLDREEYAGFLQLQTGNLMSGYFQFLPFRLESVYFAAACMCNVVDPNDNQCCLDGNDHVPLNVSQSELIDPYLDFFCYNVQKGLLEEDFTLSNPSDGLPESNTISPESDSPSVNPSSIPSEGPTLGPSGFPSDMPSLSPSTTPSEGPSNNPTGSPSKNPTNSPSVKPTEPPSASPSGFPSTAPTLFPSDIPSLGPSNYPSDTVSSSPSQYPSQSPTNVPTTEVPSATPTESIPAIDPDDTLCVDFQYVVRNQVGLDAEAIFNEVNNNVLQGLKIATETITIEILNGTYPGRRLLIEEDTGAIDTYDNDPLETHESYLRSARRQEEASYGSAKSQTEAAFEDKRESGRRKLAYYTTLLPVAINSVTDNPLCAGSAQNPQIVCAIVSSRVCVVIEEGDDPTEVRNLMITGLRQAVDSGDFLRRIPPADLTMSR